MRFLHTAAGLPVISPRAKKKMAEKNAELAEALDALEQMTARWRECFDQRAKAYRDARAVLVRHGRMPR